jgi:precorrin-6B methylase 1
MAQTFQLTHASAFLLRGTEGEPVADARRSPQWIFSTMAARRLFKRTSWVIAKHSRFAGSQCQQPPPRFIQEVLSQQRASSRAHCASSSTHLAGLEITMSQNDSSFSNASIKRQGTCTLVGAGPGDPELLTVKAVKAIQAATVLLVDDLVNEEVLKHASASLRIVYVGKRGGCKSTSQAFIEKLMINAVHDGETVVRLKGGDPFIFGRGGEEVEHLREVGIEVNIINGITSGLAAITSLGAPLTHREHAHGVVFVTGHAKPGDQAPTGVNLPPLRAMPNSPWSFTWA